MAARSLIDDLRRALGGHRGRRRPGLAVQSCARGGRPRIGAHWWTSQRASERSVSGPRGRRRPGRPVGPDRFRWPERPPPATGHRRRRFGRVLRQAGSQSRLPRSARAGVGRRWSSSGVSGPRARSDARRAPLDGPPRARRRVTNSGSAGSATRSSPWMGGQKGSAIDDGWRSIRTATQSRWRRPPSRRGMGRSPRCRSQDGRSARRRPAGLDGNPGPPASAPAMTRTLAMPCSP